MNDTPPAHHVRPPHDEAPVAIVGGGSIGIALAIVFAEAGLPVRIADTSPQMRAAVPDAVRTRLELLAEYGLASRRPAQVAALVSTGDDLGWAVGRAQLVVECVPEQLDVKRAVFARLLASAAPGIPIVSTSSAFMPSEIAGELGEGRERCLVMHPANPPYLLPVVELVPAAFTAPETVDRVAALASAAGLEPVRLQKELTGFVFNRLQGAVLREAYCLVRDGVIDVEGLDTIVRDALGPRWSVIGPFESVDLNTRGGIEAHAARLGPAYERMGAERGQHDPWTPDLVAEVTRQRRALLPLADWDARVLWRDRALAALRRLRRAERPSSIRPTVRTRS